MAQGLSEGRKEGDDKDCAGWPSTTTTTDNVTRARELLNSDQQLSVRLMADMLNVSKTQVHKILTNNIGMRKACTKMVQKVLTDNEKSRRVETCQENVNMCKHERKFFDNVITEDETWVSEYDLETKRQSSEWHTHSSPPQKKARMSKSKIKIMLIVFF